MNIYVGNLSYDATEEQLQEMFASFGEVERASVEELDTLEDILPEWTVTEGISVSSEIGDYDDQSPLVDDCA